MWHRRLPIRSSIFLRVLVSTAQPFVEFSWNPIFGTANCKSDVNLMKIGLVTVILYLLAKISLYPSFPYFMTDSEIRHKRSTRNAVENAWAPWKWNVHRGNVLFFLTLSCTDALQLLIWHNLQKRRIKLDAAFLINRGCTYFYTSLDTIGLRGYFGISQISSASCRRFL